MKKIMSMSEVLANISLCRKKMHTISQTAAFSKPKDLMFMSLANKMKDQDLFGRDKKEVESSIQGNWDSTKDTFMNFIKYSMVKELVNATHNITIPNPDYNAVDKPEITVTVAEALVLNSPTIKEYYKNILIKMKSDYNMISDTLKNHNDTVLSEESISKYITTVLSAQGEKVQSKIDISNYSSYAESYIEANKLDIIDPIKLSDKIKFLEEWIDNFYNTIGYRLSEFNSTTKVWIDLDLDQDFWGYYSDDSDNYLSREQLNID